MPGNTPCFIVKSAISQPHVLGLRGKAVHGLSGFHIPACERGFAYVDAEVSLNLYISLCMGGRSNLFTLAFCRMSSVCQDSPEIPDSIVRGSLVRYFWARKSTALNIPRRLGNMCWERDEKSISNSRRTMKSIRSGGLKVRRLAIISCAISGLTRVFFFSKTYRLCPSSREDP